MVTPVDALSSDIQVDSEQLPQPLHDASPSHHSCAVSMQPATAELAAAVASSGSLLRRLSQIVLGKRAGSPPTSDPANTRTWGEEDDSRGGSYGRMRELRLDDASDDCAVAFLRAEAFSSAAPALLALASKQGCREAISGIHELERMALGGLLTYAQWTQRGAALQLQCPVSLSPSATEVQAKSSLVDSSPSSDAPSVSRSFLQIDPATRRALELTRPPNGRRRARGSLLHAMDFCRTAMGSRLLDRRLTMPLMDARIINRRLDAVDTLAVAPFLCESVRGRLGRIADLERALQRVCVGRFTHRDLFVLRDGLSEARLLGSLLYTGDHIPPEGVSGVVDSNLVCAAQVAEHASAVRAAVVSSSQNAAVDCLLHAARSDFDVVSVEDSTSGSLSSTLAACAALLLSPLRVSVDKSSSSSHVSSPLLDALAAAHSSLADGLVSSDFSSSNAGSGTSVNANVQLSSVDDDVQGPVPETQVSSSGDGCFIRHGFSPELDSARTLLTGATGLIKELQSKLQSLTGVRTLRVRRGLDERLYVEAPARALLQLQPFLETKEGGKPPLLQLERSLKSTSRFRCVEVQSLDDDLRSAASRVRLEEQRVLSEFRRNITLAAESIALVCRTLAVVDVTAALAFAARRYNLSRPIVTADANDFVAYGVRHLVVERSLLEGWAEAYPSALEVCDEEQTAGDKSEFVDRSPLSPPAPPRTFVVNDVILGAEITASDVKSAKDRFERLLTTQDTERLVAARTVILCGANTAGKSTYLRSAAHLIILAQLGSFVPATHARLGVVDRLFARVGASDDVTRSRSTFLLEMEETAAILRYASPRSFVLIDEVGRGTAMADGLAIACAVAEDLTSRVGCRLLFATHIHELTALALHSQQSRGPSVVRCMAIDVQQPSPGSPPLLSHQLVLHPIHALSETERKTLVGDGLSSSSPNIGQAERESLELWRRVLGSSHGIHVADAAGLPRPVIERARAITALLDQSHAASAWARAVALVTSQ